jgi:serine/threonine protein kinase
VKRAPVDLLVPGDLMGAPEEEPKTDGAVEIGAQETEVLEVADADPATINVEAWGDPTADPDTDPGSIRPQLGPYRVNRRLGSGSFSEVYLATHVETGTRVAIKVSRAKLRADPHAQRRLLRELGALSSLRHPNIVSLVGTGEDPTSPSSCSSTSRAPPRASSWRAKGLCNFQRRCTSRRSSLTVSLTRMLEGSCTET